MNIFHPSLYVQNIPSLPCSWNLLNITLSSLLDTPFTIRLDNCNSSIYLNIHLVFIYLSFYLSINKFMYLSIKLTIHLSIYLTSYLYIYIFIHLSIYLYIHPSILTFIYLSFYLYIYISIYLSVYLSIYLSIYLFIYLSIFLSIYLPGKPERFPWNRSILLPWETHESTDLKSDF